MTGPENQDHWNQLAADLGAEIPESAEEPEGPSSAQPEAPGARGFGSRSQPKPAARRAARPSSASRRPSTDWSELACQLGIEPPPEPEVEEPPERPGQVDVREEAPGEDAAGAAGPKAEPVTAVAHPTDRALGPFGAGIEELTAAVQQAEVVGEAAAGPGDTTQEEAKRPAKRRRKRRRKPTRPDEPARGEGRARQPTASAEAEVSGSDAEPAGGDLRVIEAEAAGDPRDARGRKRRPRRPKAEPPAETSDGTAGPEGEGGAPPAEAAQAQPTPEKKGKERPSHRAIPSWEEAVDLIICRNMQARAKAAESGSGRHRGGRRGSRSKASDRAPGGSR